MLFKISHWLYKFSCLSCETYWITHKGVLRKFLVVSFPKKRKLIFQSGYHKSFIRLCNEFLIFVYLFLKVIGSFFNGLCRFVKFSVSKIAVVVLSLALNLIIIPRKAGYCNHLRVSVCLFVCLLAGFLINYWSDFDEIW